MDANEVYFILYFTSIWNSLPLTVRDMSLTFTGFCSRLKTELHKQAYDAPSR